MQLTVGEVCRIIAKHVERTFPNDRESIYEILDLVKEKIWFSGKFYGSTKWGWCKVREDGTIITPHGYNVLLGVKPDNAPTMDIKDKYFLFHKNGPTSSIINDKNFNNSVVEYGEYPTLLPPDKYFTGRGGEEWYVSVKSPGLGISKDLRIARVLARDYNGNIIYTYVFNNPEDPEQDGTRQLGPDEIDKYEGVIEGIDYAIKGVDVLYKNIKISSVYGIQKDPTVAPVEFWLYEAKSCANGILMARMEPNETVSSYRSYKVPNKCIRSGWVYGLFKMSKPQKTCYDSELFLTDNRSAIISIAKGVYKQNYKDQMSEGRMFIDDGIRALNDELRENKSSQSSTIQVDSVRNFSKMPEF